jgi:hypothetical protein
LSAFKVKIYDDLIKKFGMKLKSKSVDAPILKGLKSKSDELGAPTGKLGHLASDPVKEKEGDDLSPENLKKIKESLHDFDK